MPGRHSMRSIAHNGNRQNQGSGIGASPVDDEIMLVLGPSIVLTPARSGRYQTDVAQCITLCSSETLAEKPTISRMVKIFKALVGFQGRGCADVVQPNCGHPFFLEV